MHVPSELVIAHEVQFAVQAELQQTPCAQKPELQEALVVQVEPSDSRPQLVPMQVAGAVQSVLEVAGVQVFLQSLLVVSHANGVHNVEVTVWQFPAPSQVRAGVKVELGQVAAAHTVPAA
jgi:hypothetical protein